jgi:hypothetical protein
VAALDELRRHLARGIGHPDRKGRCRDGRPRPHLVTHEPDLDDFGEANDLAEDRCRCRRP